MDSIKKTISQPSGVAEIRVELITPSISFCRKAIDEKAGHQRNIKRWHKEKLITDMATDEWWFTGAPVVFNQDGRLIDGQHRLESMMKTGKFYPILVVSGVLDGSYLAIDAGSAKTTGDYFKYLGIKNPTVCAGASMMLARYDMSNHGGNIKSGSVIPKSSVEEAYMNYEQGIIGGIKAMKPYTYFIIPLSPLVASWCIVCDAFGEDFAATFFKGVAEGTHNHAAARSLYKAFRSDNLKPRKLFGVSSRFLALLQAAQWAANGDNRSRVWPNTQKVVKLNNQNVTK